MIGQDKGGVKQAESSADGLWCTVHGLLFAGSGSRLALMAGQPNSRAGSVGHSEVFRFFLVVTERGVVSCPARLPKR